MPCVNPSTTVRGCSSRLSPIKGGQHFGRNIDFVLVLALNICVCNPLLFWCIERIHQSQMSMVFFLLCLCLFLTLCQSHLLVLYHGWSLKWFGEYLLQTAERFTGNDYHSCDLTLSVPCNAAGVDRIVIDHLNTVIPSHLVEYVHSVHVANRMWAIWPEQMTRNATVAAFVQARKAWPRVGFLHYSETNMKIMRSMCAECRLQLVPFAPMVRLVRQHWHVTKQHDVCYLGTLSNRRIALNNAANRTIALITEFGHQRDIALAECRVLLNTHFDDTYQIFESLRVAWALALGVLVVSEASQPEKLTALTEHTVFFTQPEQLPTVLNDVLCNYSRLRERLIDFLESRYENTCNVALSETFLTPNK
jgi:hypothetical protein